MGWALRSWLRPAIVCFELVLSDGASSGGLLAARGPAGGEAPGEHEVGDQWAVAHGAGALVRWAVQRSLMSSADDQSSSMRDGLGQPEMRGSSRMSGDREATKATPTPTPTPSPFSQPRTCEVPGYGMEPARLAIKYLDDEN